MPTTAKIMSTGAIVLGIIVANFSTLPARAQSRTADSFNFDELSAGGKGNWNFTSEDETASIRDNLQELGEYDISVREDFNIRAIRANRRRLGSRSWANKGDRPDYFVDYEFYPYYFRKNRINNYYYY